MKVGIQTLANKKYTVDIDEKETVLALKQKIHEEHSLGEVEEQKLIYLGKILKNEQTIESAAIKVGSNIVLMTSKIKKAAAPAADGSSSSATPAPAATPAATPAANPSSTPAAATPTPPATPAAATPAAAPAATPAATPAPAAGGAAPAGTPAAANAASGQLAMGANLEAMITDLMQLGFPRDQVQAALRAAFNNPDRAADYLFNGIPESVSRSLNAAPAAGAGGAPAAGGAGAGAGAVRPPPTQAPVQQAPPPQQQQPAGAHGLSPNNPLAGLAASPQFEQMRAMLQANPQMIPVLLQQLAQSEPQLAQLIQQNPEALAELLAGGPAGGAGAGAGGAGGPRQQVIQITLEEKQQLDNLEALGFNRQRALEAWLLCDRNEDLAANYLFDHGNDDADMGQGGAGGQ